VTDDLLLDVRSLSSGYGERRVLDDVDFQVAKGEIVALLGPNGAGKSTFIASVMNVTRRFAGTIHFEGQDITRVPTRRLAGLGIAIVPQGIGVFADMNVAENLRIARSASGRDSEGQMEEQVLEIFPVLREKWRQRPDREHLQRFVPAHALELSVAPHHRPAVAIGIVETLQCRLSAGAERAAIHRVIRIALELDRASVTRLGDDTARGGALAACRRVVGGYARYRLIR